MDNLKGDCQNHQQMVAMATDRNADLYVFQIGVLLFKNHPHQVVKSAKQILLIT